MSEPQLCRVVFLDADTLPCGLPFDDATRARLDYIAHGHTPPDEVLARLAGAEVAVVNKVKLTADWMAQLPALRRICIAAAGTDNVDLQAAAARGIKVFNVPDYGSDAVAEHVMTVLLALRRHLLDYSRAAVDGRWAASAHFCWHGEAIKPVAGMLLGVVGRGRIGQATARLAQGLGMRVVFAERPGRTPQADEWPLERLLRECDAISLHVPLTPDTRGLINAARLAWMKPGALLINTGRGALVDAPALIEALTQGHLGGAALDVLDVEPPPASHPLLQPGIPNLLVTPHVAWASEQAQQRLAASLVARIGEYLSERGAA